MTKLPQRKSPRLPDYDYSQSGGSFITICTLNRQHLFGNIADETMNLSAFGQIANDCWIGISDIYPDVTVGDYVIMPNHMHGVLYLNSNQTFKTIVCNVIRGYKGTVTRLVRDLEQSKRIVWQSRYYDHILRDGNDDLRIQEYIQNNVAKWEYDTLYGDE